MADNVPITAGSGTTIATDQLGTGEHVQFVKIMDGTLDGTTKVAAGANGLAVSNTDADKIADNAGFTDGTTKVMPTGFILDEVAGTALSENDIGSARMDSKRSVVVTLEDATTRGQRATVLSTGSVQIQGYQPTAVTFSAVIATGALASQGVSGLNVVTVTLRTFTGTTPSITWKLQASDDNTNWVDIQGINNNSGLVGVSWTQGAALTAGTAGPSIDYTVGGYSNVRINVTAISGASATAAFGLASETMPYEASPGAVCQGLAASGATAVGNPVLIGGSDGTNAQVLPVTAISTQGAKAVAVQNLRDSGRTEIQLYTTNVTAPATATETLVTMTKAAGTGATSSATSFVVTNNKRFRITSILFATRGNATATTQVGTLSLRINTGGAITTSSTPVTIAVRSATPATASAWDRVQITMGEGYEIIGNGTIQFGFSVNFTYVTNAPTFDVYVNGYEY